MNLFHQRCSWLLVGLTVLAGCRSTSWPDYWPFPDYERTSFHTPSMRVDAIQQFAAKSKGVDSPEQRELTDQLARQIQVEPDPLVRKAVVHAIAEYRTPIVPQVLEAGLKDQNVAVRIACCQAIGKRGDASAIPNLATALREDKSIDVRLAAAEALGGIKSPEAIQALTVALDDRDPALQYAGVESMKSITGKDYGGSVEAWRQVAAGQTPPPVPTPSIADRMKRMSPFK